MVVTPALFSSSTLVQIGELESSSIHAEEWETTQTWVLWAALRINLPNAGMRSGCRLVSGSFNTIKPGGRGVRRAAVQRRYRKVPSESSVADMGRFNPDCQN